MAGKTDLIPLSRAMASQLGISIDRPFIGFAGVEPAPRSRGKRSIVIDGKRMRVVGMGGLQWREGLCWMWLDKIDMSNRPSAITVVRAAHLMVSKAQQMGEKMVVVARDEAPNSRKLLTMLGFQQLPELPEFAGIEVWVKEWQHSPQSQLSPPPPQP